MAQYRRDRARGLALPATGYHGGGDRGLDQGRGGAVVTRELDPRDVLADLFGSGDFPPEILLDSAHAADIVVQRLLDAGFAIAPARSA
jgi:hypothetical protein